MVGGNAREAGIWEGERLTQEWRAELLRLLFFVAADAQLKDARAYFEDAAGVGAEVYAGGAGNSNAAGPADGFNFSVSVQAGRVELVLRAQDRAENLGPAPDIEDLQAALGVLARLGSGVCAGIGPNRLAVHIQLNQEFEAPANPAELLNGALGKGLFPPNTTHLLYQFNSRATLDGTGIEINRIGKWGDATRQVLLFAVNIPGQVVPVSPSPPSIASKQCVYFHLDVNTAPSEQNLSRPKLAMEELIAEAGRLAIGGRNAF